ncbi:MAG: I78 family peptidase inhibitor [Rhodospirillaceae bacterium]|nr:I78 family peptidase inhibitor [Rhodospirillaceae bacterium]
MLKIAMVPVVLLLGGCVQSTEMKAPDAVPVVGVTTTVKSSFYDCTRQVLEMEKMVGKKPAETNYFPVRILAPNAAMTMDHNLSRLNIYVDGSGNILSAKCG